MLVEYAANSNSRSNAMVPHHSSGLDSSHLERSARAWFAFLSLRTPLEGFGSMMASFELHGPISARGNGASSAYLATNSGLKQRLGPYGKSDHLVL